MIGLIVVEQFDPLPGVSQSAIDAGIVVLVFVGMLGWVHVNGGVLERYYMEQDGKYDLKITVYPLKPKDNGTDGRDVTKYEIVDSRIHWRGWRDIALEEKEKWSRN